MKIPLFVVSLLTTSYVSGLHARDSYCRNGLFPAENKTLELARFVGSAKERLYFYDDGDGCPGGAQCKTGRYVIPGDELIINKRENGWGCAWFQGQKHETVGWVSVAKLRFLEPQTVPEEGWLGNWVQPAGSITITGGGGKPLHGAGEAFWQSEVTIHVGEFSGTIRPVNNRATVKEGDDESGCVVALVRLGRYLIASDNGNCGGVNVRFDGVYVRKRVAVLWRRHGAFGFPVKHRAQQSVQIVRKLSDSEERERSAAKPVSRRVAQNRSVARIDDSYPQQHLVSCLPEDRGEVENEIRPQFLDAKENRDLSAGRAGFADERRVIGRGGVCPGSDHFDRLKARG